MADTDKSTAPEAEIIEAKQMAPSKALARAVSVGPAQLRRQMKRDQEIRLVVDEYIKNNMIDGKDYGSIKVKGATSKPSLFKPGAEKFCGLFKIRATFRKDPETVEMLGNKSGIIAYICELVDSQGRVIGEGRGAYSVSPEASDFDINKAVKIAEKRAQIDAVLRAGGLSDFFTQDMEDAPRDVGNNSMANTSYPATDKQRALIARKLAEQGISLEKTDSYLKKQYDVDVPLTKNSASFVIEQLIDEDGAR